MTIETTSTPHEFVGEHPDHCFFAINDGVGQNERAKFTYCGARNEDSAVHTPNLAMLVARDLIELLDSERAHANIADYANALAEYDANELQEMRSMIVKLIGIRKQMNFDLTASR